MIRLLFRAVISVVLVVEVAAVSFGGAFGSVGRWLKERGLVSCGFVDNPLAALDDNEDGLRKRIVSQDWAISTILDAFETQRPISNDKTTHRLVPPMFLYFVGPTGVGKTFTAINIAEIIQDTDRDPVLLRGENYNNDATTVDEYHRQIQTVLKHHLKPCKGRNVVIFDEVQKVAPKTLDVFGPILDNGQFEFVTHEGKVEKVDCHGTIFIFISDFGVSKIIEAAILEKGEDLRMRRRAKEGIDDLLGDLSESMAFLRNIKTVVPFLPLRQSDIKVILRKQLDEMVAAGSNSIWLGVTFDEVYYDYLSSHPHVKYLEYSAVAQDASETDEGQTAGELIQYDDFAEYGARSVALGPVDSVRRKLFRLVRNPLNNKPAHFHFSLVPDSRCEVGGTTFYVTEIKYCTLKKKECDAKEDAWKVGFVGDLEHDSLGTVTTSK